MHVYTIAMRGVANFIRLFRFGDIWQLLNTSILFRLYLCSIFPHNYQILLESITRIKYITSSKL